MERDMSDGERRLRGLAAVLEGDERACVLEAVEEIAWLQEVNRELLAAIKSLLKLQPQERGSIEVEIDLEAAVTKAEGGGG